MASSGWLGNLSMGSATHTHTHSHTFRLTQKTLFGRFLRKDAWKLPLGATVIAYWQASQIKKKETIMMMMMMMIFDVRAGWFGRHLTLAASDQARLHWEMKDGRLKEKKKKEKAFH